MTKQCIRLYIGDNDELLDTGERCVEDLGGKDVPTHTRKLLPPKYALYKASAYFTHATAYPSLAMWRPKDADKPTYEDSFVLEIITAASNAWIKALMLAEDLRVSLQQDSILVVSHDITNTQLVELQLVE